MNKCFEYPLIRLLISILCAIFAGFLTAFFPISDSVRFMILWDVFAFTILLLDWRLLYKHSRQPVHKQSIKEEGNIFLVSILIIASIFACLIFVFLLLFDQNSDFINGKLGLGLTLFGIVCSWFMLHTIFTLHYIRKYYQLQSKGIKALVFSDEKEEPEYRDFIYFAFVVGCTFQVADFVTNDKSMRQLVLLHCLLSFWLNTFVVALTINLIAGKG